MKQEQANTFSEGINYDMNPLVMNNKALSDCVNGTLVTFNGDELALQNDGGNATIKYNVGTRQNPIWEPVSLSPGYYPIGVKEYGGILYIVSACNANTIEEWTIEKEKYYPSNLVKVKTGSGWNYYRCLNIPEEKISPDLDSDNWVLESSLERVEIGSFPSPDRPTMSNGGNAPIILNMFNDKRVLHKSAVINNGDFRAGNYISFILKNTLNSELSNISYYSYSDESTLEYHPKVYRVRLLQQLTNGFVDLTPNVWDQYASYKGYSINNTDAISQWFSDPDFKFYCPNNYKGKLAIIVELEPLNKFKLISSIINYENQLYKFNFRVQLENESEVDIRWALLTSSINTSTPIVQTPILIPFINGVAETTFSLKWDETQSKRNLNYEITPVICSTETNFLTNCRGDYINIKEIDPKKFFTNWIPLSQNTNITVVEDKSEGILSQKKFTWSGTDGFKHLWPIPPSEDIFILSFKVKGSSGSFEYGIHNVTTNVQTLLSETMTGEWKSISLPISGTLNLNDEIILKSSGAGNYELSDIKLELGTTVTPWTNSIDSISYLDTDLPEEYLTDNKYIIQGSKLISSAYDDVLLVRDETSSGYRCGLTYDGTTYTMKFILKNNKGDTLDPTLEISETEYYFREYNPDSPTLPSNCLGEYTITIETNEKSKPVLTRWNESLQISLTKYLQDLLESQNATYQSDYCNLRELTIVTSKVLIIKDTPLEYGKVSVEYTSESGTVLFTTTDGINYKGLIKPNVPFILKVEYGSGNTYHTEGTPLVNGISDDITLYYAVITKFTVYKKVVTTDPETYVLYLYSQIPYGMTLKGLRTFKYKVYESVDPGDWGEAYIRQHNADLPITDVVGYLSDKLMDETFSAAEYTCVIDFNLPEYSAPTTNYINITTNSDYRLVGTGTPSEGYEIIKVENN